MSATAHPVCESFASPATARFISAGAFLQALNNALGGSLERPAMFAERARFALLDILGDVSRVAPISDGAVAAALALALTPDTVHPNAPQVAALASVTLIGQGEVEIVDLAEVANNPALSFVQPTLGETLAHYVRTVRALAEHEAAPLWIWEVGDDRGEISARLTVPMGGAHMALVGYGGEQDDLRCDTVRRITGPLIAECVRVGIALTVPAEPGSLAHSLQHDLAAQEAAGATLH